MSVHGEVSEKDKNGILGIGLLLCRSAAVDSCMEQVPKVLKLGLRPAYLWGSCYGTL